LTLGAAASVLAQNFSAALEGSGTPNDRARRLLSVVERSAGFRDKVLKEYAFKCVVTDLETSPVPASRLKGLIEAAHVQPVSAGGPDDISNGLTLTPSVHRLFDAGLFTLEESESSLRVKTSPLLLPDMVVSTNGANLGVYDGRPVNIGAGKLSPDFLRHHQRLIFRAS
jgi:putative restriction endonuclease